MKFSSGTCATSLISIAIFLAFTRSMMRCIRGRVQSRPYSRAIGTGRKVGQAKMSVSPHEHRRRRGECARPYVSIVSGWVPLFFLGLAEVGRGKHSELVFLRRLL